MKTPSVIILLSAFLCCVLLFLPISNVAGEQRRPLQSPNEKDVYIGLTEEFYRALQAESDSGNKVYSNRPSDEYLRQIAISAKFMVETNLRLLQMQERMIELLEKGRTRGTP